MDDPSPAVAELDEKNSLALAIIPVGKCFKFNSTRYLEMLAIHQSPRHKMDILTLGAITGSTNPPTSTGSNFTNGTSGWELALVEAPSSNESAATASKLVQLRIFLVLLLLIGVH